MQSSQGQWFKSVVKSEDHPDAGWETTTWFAGPVRLKITGGTRMWGPWVDKYQVWEASLTAHEKRTVTLETGRATQDELAQVATVTGIKAAPSAQGEESDEPALSNRECEVCGIKFVDFRNTGRLGCPHDYQEFREELLPLLENIHGETRHCGKTPRRLPQNKQTQSELIQLRNRLKQAITKEDYEEAARLRDRIRILEES